MSFREKTSKCYDALESLMIDDMNHKKALSIYNFLRYDCHPFISYEKVEEAKEIYNKNAVL